MYINIENYLCICKESCVAKRIHFKLLYIWLHSPNTFSIKANISALMQVPSSDALKMHCKRHLHMCQNICFLWKKYSASVFMHRNHNVNFDTNVLYSNLLHLKTTNIIYCLAPAPHERESTAKCYMCQSWMSDLKTHEHTTSKTGPTLYYFAQW